MRNFEYVIKSCPSCGADVTWSGVDIVCTDPDCSARTILKTEYFLRLMGAENITAITLEKIGVSTIKDLYTLDELEIASLEGFGIKRAEQIISEIQKTLKTTPDKFLAACGVSGVGLETARSILKEYPLDEKFFHLTSQDFSEVSGVGDVLAENMEDALGYIKELYDFLVEQGLKWSTAANTLRGKTFCLTGNGPIGRDIIIRMVESNGGYVKGMSRKVDALVTNDPNSTSGKAKKAREYGVSVISYEDLLEMMK